MFKDIWLLKCVSPGLSWGPGFSTDIVIEGGGDEVRNQNWSEPRREADAAKACKNEQARKDLIASFRIAAGMAYSFKTRDWSDYKVIRIEGIVRDLGDGTFQLAKRHTIGGFTSDEDVTLPEQGTIVLWDQSGVLLTETTDYTIDYTTGIVTTVDSPDPRPTSWSGQYFVRVRFNTDRIALVAETIEVFRSQNIPLIQVRLEEEES